VLAKRIVEVLAATSVGEMPAFLTLNCASARKQGSSGTFHKDSAMIKKSAQDYGHAFPELLSA
jgi:hypothetical protein